MPANNTGETWGFMIVVVAAMVVVAAKASEQAKQAQAHREASTATVGLTGYNTIVLY